MTARTAVWAFVIAMLVASWLGSCVLYQAAEMGDRVAPVPPRESDRLTVVTVGTGGAYENPARRGPATAVAFGERVVLVDAGRGIAEGLRAARIPVSQPDTLFVTNLLPENTVGLDDLLFAGWLAPRSAPLRVIGPIGTAALVAGVQASHATGRQALGQALDLPESGADLEVLEVGDGWSEERGGIRVRAGALEGGPLPALAWHFEAEERTAVISGTGWGPDSLVAFAEGADILVHEAVYVPTPEDAEAAGVEEDPERLRREALLHTSLLDVGALAQRAGVASLVLVRMRPPPLYAVQVTSLIGDDFEGDVHVPEDGDEFVP